MNVQQWGCGELWWVFVLLFSHMFESQNNDEIIRYNLFLNDR